MSKNPKALEFKGRMLSLTRVLILDDQPEMIQQQVSNFGRQLGEAASGMPMLLEAERNLDIRPAVDALRAAGMQPIAMLDGPANNAALDAGLPLIPADALSSRPARAVEQPSPSPKATPAPPAEPPPAAQRKPARVINSPVRSGQQIYAEGADLVVTSTVNPGAEIIADGCIHVYSALRGRAIAGAKGDSGARIFCHTMEAELLAVSGIYSVAEQIRGVLRGCAVQAFLQEGKLKIEELKW
ncbi:MAG: septum site-determining protein MinC [Panacagrimonas sp.]